MKKQSTMFKLSENWLSEGLMDVEYKQYLLLAYIRDVHEVFNHKILYPAFAELIEHHRYLKTIKNNLKRIKESEKELQGIDWESMKLIYSYNTEKEQDVLEQIIDFSIPKIEKEIQHGKRVFNDIESKLKYTTVGLMPLHKNIGYFFIQNYPNHEMLVYQYELSDLYMQTRDGNVPFKSLKTEYIATYSFGIGNSLTSIKQEIIKRKPDIPNPAVYSFFPNQVAPMEHTVLPVVKRVLMKLVA